MTTLLIVDDDPGQLRVLARALSMRRRDLTVLTASHGLEAIEVLEIGPVDVVLTDLQMPEMNGFDLLAWLHEHRPHVPVYSMTAFPAEATERLAVLGSIECFTKPLDIPSVLERVSRVLAESARGHVRDIALPAFLQLLEMEKKTCTLTVVSGEEVGYLHLHRGELVDARHGEVVGLEAAWAMLGWAEPSITIQRTVGTPVRSIELPTSFVILEGLRRADEGTRETGEWEIEASPPAPAPVQAPPLEPPRRPSAPLSRFPVYLPADASVIALVEATSGRVRAAAGQMPHLDAHAELIANLYAAQAAAIERQGDGDRLEELVVTMRASWTLVRPVRVDAASLVMLVFDPARVNLVYERRELSSFVDELEAWCARVL